MGILDDAFLKSLWVFHLATGSCNNCDIEILDCLTPAMILNALECCSPEVSNMLTSC